MRGYAICATAVCSPERKSFTTAVPLALQTHPAPQQRGHPIYQHGQMFLKVAAAVVGHQFHAR